MSGCTRWDGVSDHVRYVHGGLEFKLSLGASLTRMALEEAVDELCIINCPNEDESRKRNAQQRFYQLVGPDGIFKHHPPLDVQEAVAGLRQLATVSERHRVFVALLRPPT